MDIIPSAKINPGISNKIADRKIENIQAKLQTPGAGKTEDELMKVSGLIDSFSMDTFQSMMDQEIANEMAKKKGMGLANMVYRQLTRLEGQQVKPGTAPPDANRAQKIPINIGTTGGSK